MWTNLRVYDETPYEHCVDNETHAAMLVAAQRRATPAQDIAVLIKQHEIKLANPSALPAATILGNCAVDLKDRPLLVAVTEQVEAGLQAARYALASGIADDIHSAAELIANFDDSIPCDPDRTVSAATSSNKVGPHRLFGGNSIVGLDLAFATAHRQELSDAVRAKAFEAQKNWPECVKLSLAVPEHLRLAAIDDIRTKAATDCIQGAIKKIDAAEETMREADASTAALAKEEYLESFSVLLAVQNAIETSKLNLPAELKETVQSRVTLGNEFYKGVEPCSDNSSIFLLSV